MARRIGVPFLGAILIALLLFWLMQWLILAPQRDLERPQVSDAVSLVPPPPPEEEVAPAASAAPSAEAEPPPPVPSLARPDALAVLPKTDESLEMATPDIALSANPKTGSGLGSAFGGYAGGGSGSGGGGSGYGYGGGGRGTGRDLVPLSTARPQIPQYACDNNIEGWIDIVFNVKANGRVTNIRIVDANPKGLFEEPTIRSVSNWLFESNKKGKAYQVGWRFEFKTEDCAFNWDT